uniref:ATP synthase F0 subunit 8 n=1 Tax=Sipunculus nudus TaxID=6446 RepID=A0A0U1WM93_SIPNU|nr:ATP synthase F0 subunit 8 [Sipunculus nudus]AWK60879.1 ATP synthase F0 subunit 8 [Sipunculus nudus]
MPHLAPMSWILVTMIFWVCLLMLISFSWWQQTPKFNQLPQTMSPTLHKSKWSW